MNDIENKVGLILAGLVVFVFLMVVAFIKRNNRAKADDIETFEFPDDDIQAQKLKRADSEHNDKSKR